MDNLRQARALFKSSLSYGRAWRPRANTAEHHSAMCYKNK